MSSVEFDAEEKLIKARVQLQKDKPFWSYLCMNLNFIKDNETLESCAVDRYGNFYFNEKFVNSLTDEEIKGVMAHEVMHCALEHMDRGKNRNHRVFNISADTVVNAILIEDGLSLPKDSIIPHNNEIDLFGIKFKKVTDKTSEEVYDKLWRKLGKEYKKAIKEIENALKGMKGFDKHIYAKNGENGKGKQKCPKCAGTGKDKDGKECKACNGKGEQEVKKVDWKKKLVDACSYARQRGTLPAGMERIVGKLLETYIDWRGLLYKYITSQIPIDYTWARPSKRSHSLGYYLPAVEKEQIDVMVAVDTSGSISQKELVEVISEISSITGSFKNVDLTVIDCDCRINGIHELRNANKQEVINKIGKNLKGGGGTSHIPVFNWINKNKPTAKFVIAFTDGYTSFPPTNQVHMPVLWIVAGNWRADIKSFPFGKVIELPKRD